MNAYQVKSATNAGDVIPLTATGRDRLAEAPRIGRGRDPRLAGPGDDSGHGLAMFLVFVASALVVTGVVWALAAAGAWWLLPAAFAIHIAMTGVVTLAVLRALNNSHQPDHGSPPTAMPGPTTRT